MKAKTTWIVERSDNYRWITEQETGRVITERLSKEDAFHIVDLHNNGVSLDELKNAIKKSVFIEHLTELQQKELWSIINEFSSPQASPLPVKVTEKEEGRAKEAVIGDEQKQQVSKELVCMSSSLVPDLKKEIKRKLFQRKLGYGTTKSQKKRLKNKLKSLTLPNKFKRKVK